LAIAENTYKHGTEVRSKGREIPVVLCTPHLNHTLTSEPLIKPYFGLPEYGFPIKFHPKAFIVVVLYELEFDILVELKLPIQVALRLII